MKLAATDPRGGRDRGLARLRLSSIEVNHVNDELVAALRETPRSRRTSTFRSSPATTGSCRRWRAATPAPICAGSSRSRDFNLTADVIVGFPAEDDAAFAAHARDRRAARADEGARLSVLAAAGHEDRRDDTVPPEVKRERGARLRAASARRACARWREKLGARTSCWSTGRPWLRRRLLAVARRRQVGELVPVRGAAVTQEGILAA